MPLPRRLRPRRRGRFARRWAGRCRRLPAPSHRRRARAPRHRRRRLRSRLARALCRTRGDDPRRARRVRPARRAHRFDGRAGLAAKPLIDVLLVVDDPAEEPWYLPALQAAGYVLRIREPDFTSTACCARPPGMCTCTSSPPTRPRSNATCCCANAARRRGRPRAYAATKRRLAARHWPTMQHYAEAKSTVIEAIIARRATTGSARMTDNERGAKSDDERRTMSDDERAATATTSAPRPASERRLRDLVSGRRAARPGLMSDELAPFEHLSRRSRSTPSG